MKSSFDENLKLLAPLGYEFIEESLNPNHFEEIEKKKVMFSQMMPQILKESFNDYRYPAISSIKLVDEDIDFNDSLISSLLNRTSVRNFIKKPASLGQLSLLLKLASGCKPTASGKPILTNRFYPSGGMHYTTRIYVDIRNVEAIAKGLYHYNALTNCLDLINDEVSNEDRMQLHNNSETAATILNSCFEILISTKPCISLKKYGEHGWKTILMEIGHLTQNLWLVAVACGFAAYPCSSLNRIKSEEVLRTLSTHEFLLQSLIVGYYGNQVE